MISIARQLAEPVSGALYQELPDCRYLPGRCRDEEENALS
jgi:hypothetical protein